MKFLHLFLLFGLSWLTACASPTPYIIYLTLPAPTATATPSPTPTATPTPNLTATLRAAQTATTAYYATLAVSLLDERATLLARTPAATPSPTPTVDPTAYVTWAQFENLEWGVAFEYPAYFARPPYSEYGCAPRLTADHMLEIGHQLLVTRLAFDLAQNNLAQYVADWREKFEAQAVANPADENVITATTWGQVGGVSSVTVQYRLGALGINATATYLAHQNWLYELVWLENSATPCEFMIARHDERSPPGEALGELDAYWHLLESWQFVD